jgi:hypothetical protein
MLFSVFSHIMLDNKNNMAYTILVGRKGYQQTKKTLRVPAGRQEIPQDMAAFAAEGETHGKTHHP